ncbi:hypothetical protein R3P38DRAFT_2878414 [Favolaschia claudopus]|uniref:Secreted protein n=1 Tax=Favolaschia claudopus TaxID=2862362 RepID=A0AAW0CYA8_9AGAR
MVGVTVTSAKAGAAFLTFCGSSILHILPCLRVCVSTHALGHTNRRAEFEVLQPCTSLAQILGGKLVRWMLHLLHNASRFAQLAARPFAFLSLLPFQFDCIITSHDSEVLDCYTIQVRSLLESCFFPSRLETRRTCFFCGSADASANPPAPPALPKLSWSAGAVQAMIPPNSLYILRLECTVAPCCSPINAQRLCEPSPRNPERPR